MTIGERLKQARKAQHFTQEQIAGQLQVSRQTISNWETNKSYPDIVNLIKLSNLYHISLDQLLKEDSAMINHLAESTDTVASNQKLLLAIGGNILMLVAFIIFNSLISHNVFLTFTCFILVLAGLFYLFYQIINRI